LLGQSSCTIIVLTVVSIAQTAVGAPPSVSGAASDARLGLLLLLLLSDGIHVRRGSGVETRRRSLWLGILTGRLARLRNLARGLSVWHVWGWG
jgi:hypothetical protein